MSYNAAFLFCAFASWGQSAAGFNLRAGANTKSTATTAAADSRKRSNDPSYDVRIIIDGLLHVVTDSDLNIIQTSILEAYNDAHKAISGNVLLSVLEPQSHFALSSRCQKKPLCGFCTSDDDATLTEEESEPMVQSDIILATFTPGNGREAEMGGMYQIGSNHHQTFQESFCTKIRSSGSENLANAHGCSFSYLEKLPPGAEQGTVVSAEAQVVMFGTLNSLSTAEFELLDNIITAAFNEAFVGTGYSLNSIQSVSDLAAANHSNDDGSSMMSAIRIVSARTQTTVAAENQHADVDSAKLAFLHNAFEKSVCNKLEKSGSANFANVHDCTFRFVYNPATNQAAALDNVAGK